MRLQKLTRVPMYIYWQDRSHRTQKCAMLEVKNVGLAFIAAVSPSFWSGLRDATAQRPHRNVVSGHRSFGGFLFLIGREEAPILKANPSSKLSHLARAVRDVTTANGSGDQ